MYKRNVNFYFKKMRIATIRKLDISNGEGCGVALFTQGCPFHCFNCFNSETWDFNGGVKYEQKHEDMIIELLNKEYITRLSILGGEPLIKRNIKDLEKLIMRVRKVYGKSKKIWLYTGQLVEDVLEMYPEIIKNVDVVVDGRYEDDKRDVNLKWCGSSNQRVIDIEDLLCSK